MFQPSTKYAVALGPGLISPTPCFNLGKQTTPKVQSWRDRFGPTVARKACKDEIGKITHWHAEHLLTTERSSVMLLSLSLSLFELSN